MAFTSRKGRQGVQKDTGYSIDNSLRFNDDDSAYLSRTPSVAGNRKTWTWSGWVKRGNLGTYQSIFAVDNSSTEIAECYWDGSDNSILWHLGGGSNYRFYTNAVYRDSSSWYHIICSLDTTISSPSGNDTRMKLYVNGEQVTSFRSNVTPSLNYEGLVNLDTQHEIGERNGTNNPLDGYLAEVNFVDGQALTPADFGETGDYGEWKAIAYAGTYGTNGFYLDFANKGTKHTITANGNAQHSTAQSKIGASSIAFDGTNDLLTIPHHTDFDLGEEFTIEAWVRLDNLSNSSVIVGKGTHTTSVGEWLFLWNGSNGPRFRFMQSGSYVIDVKEGSNSGYSTGVWYHISVVKTSNYLKIYTDGVEVASTNYSNISVTADSNKDLILGYASTFVTYFDGYLDEIRISNTARYTTTFTPSTTAFTEDANTLLLIHSDTTNGSTTFTDSSGVIGGLGNDQSGTANHWTPNNLVATDQMLDSPTNNFCTMNPLDDDYAGVTTFSEGNLKTARGTNHGVTRGTIGMSSSKWYMECLVGATTNGSSAVYFGVVDSQVAMTANISGVANCWVTYSSSSNDLTRDGAIDNIVGVFTAGDILQIALDLDAGKIWIGKNNVWWDSANGLTGNPSAGTNEFDTVTSSDFNGDSLYPAIGSYANNAVANFGQDSSFAGNKTAQGNADDNGYGDFYYTPPTGYLALCTQNLPEPTVVPSEHFDTVLWTGDDATSRSITGVGFQPDFTWIKRRDNSTHHLLSDAVRGAHYAVLSNDTRVEGYQRSNGYTSSFNSDGFTLQDGGDTHATYTGVWETNILNGTYAAWNWKANGAGVSNTNGTITSTVSANADAGFSIVKIPTNAAEQTVGHGLTKAPELIFFKARSVASHWDIWYKDFTDYQAVIMNSTSAVYTNGSLRTVYSTSSTTMGLGLQIIGSAYYGVGNEMIAYCFHSVDGYSKVGSYTGNGSADGTFVHCGFRPAYVMIKASDAVEPWMIMDVTRHPYNENDAQIQANSSSIELNDGNGIDMLSNGFKIKSAIGNWGTSGITYIYLAFAEHPFKYTNAR